MHPDEAAEKSKQTARYDFHQIPDKIYVNIYCKGIIPAKTKVIISSQRIDINVSICLSLEIYSILILAVIMLLIVKLCRMFFFILWSI